MGDIDDVLERLHRRHEGKEDAPAWHPDDDLTAEDLPSDAMAAFQALQPQLKPALDALGAPPLATRAQLSTILTDATGLARDLDHLRRTGRLRFLHLTSGPTPPLVLVPTDAYAAALRAAAAAGAHRHPALPRAVDALISAILPSSTSPGILRTDALAALRAALPDDPPDGAAAARTDTGDAAAPPAKRRRGAGGPVASGGGSLRPEVAALKALEDARVLVSSREDPDALVFSFPAAARVAALLTGARRDLARALARRRGGEVLLSKLGELKGCPAVPPEQRVFVAREMEGRGEVERVRTAVGPSVRLRRGAEALR